jgi:uncharacterized damage-inducible protein DinB
MFNKKDIIMNSLDILKELIDHMNWADGRIWTVVLSIPEAQNDEKLKKILHHYQLSKYAFYYTRTDLPQKYPELEEFITLYDMAQWAAEYPKLIHTYMSDLKEADLSQMIKTPPYDRLEQILGQKPVDANLAETILQVAVHCSHHRGQVNSRIRELNGEPPIVDFIAWVWLGKPNAIWPV